MDAGKVLSVFCLAAALAVARESHAAATNNWIGVNTANKTLADYSVDEPANWSLGRVPGIGNDDVAFFELFNTGAQTNICIAATNLFNPSGLLFQALSSGNSKQLLIDKPLALDSLYVHVFTSPSSGSGTLWTSRVVFGSLATNDVIVALTGNGEVLDISSYNDSWRLLNMKDGNVTLDFTGSDIVFSSRNRARTPDDSIDGGSQTENTNNTANAIVRFSTPEARVHLGDQSVKGATIGLGYANFELRHDQAWTADPYAFVRVSLREVPSGGSAPLLVKSIAGDRLDNLGEINFHIKRSNARSGAMLIHPGTYGSLNFANASTSSQNTIITLAGDTIISGNAVVAPMSGTIPATNMPFGIHMNVADSNLNKWIFDIDGHSLVISNGLKIVQRRDDSGSWARVNASGATLSIGGDYVLEHVVSLKPTRETGICGDAGTTVRFGGSFDVQGRSRFGTSVAANNLKLSTVKFVGGPEIERTFEVGDASNAVATASGTFMIGNMMVGDAGTPGRLRLVNNHLNDNLVGSTVADADLANEKLMAGALFIADGSELVVNAQCAEIATSLEIAPSGKLDLATGAEIISRIVLNNFRGCGDQADEWNMFAENVRDSSNRNITFRAVYDIDADRTYWRVHQINGRQLIIVR